MHSHKKTINRHVKSNGTYSINITFISSTYKAIIELSSGYQLDIRNSKFGKLLGFDPKIIATTEYGLRLPNITNSINTIHIKCNLTYGKPLLSIAIDNLKQSVPFIIELRRAIFNEIGSNRNSPY